MNEKERLLKEIIALAKTKQEAKLYNAQAVADARKLSGDFAIEIVETVSNLLENAEKTGIAELEERLINLKALSATVTKANLGSEGATLIGIIGVAEDAIKSITLKKKNFLDKAKSSIKKMGSSFVDSISDIGSNDAFFQMLGTGASSIRDKVSDRLKRRQEKNTLFRDVQVEKLKTLRNMQKEEEVVKPTPKPEPRTLPKTLPSFWDDEDSLYDTPPAPFKNPLEMPSPSGWVMENQRDYLTFGNKEPLEINSEVMTDKLSSVMNFVQPIPEMASTVEKIYNLLDFDRIRKIDEDFDRVAAIERQSELLEQQTELLGKAVGGTFILGGAGVSGGGGRSGGGGGSISNRGTGIDPIASTKDNSEAGGGGGGFLNSFLGTAGALLGGKGLGKIFGKGKGVPSKLGSIFTKGLGGRLKAIPGIGALIAGGLSAYDASETAEKNDASWMSGFVGNFLGGGEAEGGFINALEQAATMGLIASPTVNPIAIGGGALLGGVTGYLGKDKMTELTESIPAAANSALASIYSGLRIFTPEGGDWDNKLKEKVEAANKSAEDAEYASWKKKLDKNFPIGKGSLMPKPGTNFSPEATKKAEEIAKRLGVDPLDLLAMMYLETDRTFSPSVKNPLTDATGLIQFMPKTARGLGTSISELEKMSQEQQLDYVAKYFEDAQLNNKMKSIEDLYLMILGGTGRSDLLGASPDQVVFRGGTANYEANKNAFPHTGRDLTIADISPVVQSYRKQVEALFVQTATEPQEPTAPELQKVKDLSEDFDRRSTEAMVEHIRKTQDDTVKEYENYLKNYKDLQLDFDMPLPPPVKYEEFLQRRSSRPAPMSDGKFLISSPTYNMYGSGGGGKQQRNPAQGRQSKQVASTKGSIQGSFNK